MIPIHCDKCVLFTGGPVERDCEWNANFHKHTCRACLNTIWLEGGPEDDDPTHTRSIMRGNCHLLPKSTP